jgi:hypothetical protein
MAEPRFLPWRFVSGALAGAGFVATTQIVTKDALSLSLFIATVCFAFSVPTMVAFFFYPPSFLPKREETLGGAYARFHVLYALSFVASVIGLALLFFSFGFLPGCAYIIAAATACWIVTFGSAHKAHDTGFR